MSNTLREILTESATLLAEHSENPRLEAELLLARAMDRDRSYLYTWPDRKLDETQQEAFDNLLQQRMEGHPLAYILGHREFWSLELEVTPDVLIPRSDTETLVERALEKIPAADSQRILDLGTGSGAIAIAIASERPRAIITAVDHSEAALHVAERNAQKLQLNNLKFIHSDWYQSLHDEPLFDLIVSNPPYIRDNDPHLDQGDLPHEPRSALASGHDGLDDIRKILAGLDRHLRPGGWLIVEHGYDQAAPVKKLFIQSGLSHISCFQDVQGLDRITAGQLNA